MRRVLLLLCVFTALFGYQAAFAANDRPNVVLIFSDDQGTLDLNSFGSDDLHTPHLDRLAGRGTRFTQFYVGAPVCSPSRASLLTGRFTIRAGVPGNVSSQPGKPGMPTEQVTIAEVLKPAGYRCGIFGKWHLGTIPECDPLGQGFDEFFGHKAGCIDNYSHFFYWRGPHFHDMWRDRTEYWEQGTHFSDMIVREAKRFVDQHQEKPFFMYLPFNIPHYPMQADIKFQRMYDHLPEPRRAYAALVTHLDDAVGQVINHIDKAGLTKNTLIIFLSDHGHSTEERCNFGGGNAGPYRGAKFSLFEGGIRVPCIASLPGTIPENAVRDQFCTSLDWLPTIAELCGAELPDRKIDGKSLMPVLRDNADSQHNQFFWKMGPQWAVRDGNWKLIGNPRDTSQPDVKFGKEDKLYLVDLDTDPGEVKNLSNKHPELVQRLKKDYDAWLKDVSE